MSFTPTILDLGITYGTIVTYRFNTTIVVLGDGSEQRIIRWNQPLARYQIGQRDVDGDTLDTLLAFFNARQGSYQGFLFKDWADYRYGGGASKTYTADGETVTRPILHPDTGGETFTVPVRFEQDKIDFRFKAYRPGDGAKIFTLENLSLVEIRQAPETPLALDPLPGTLGLLDLGYDYETTGGPVFSTSTAGNNAGWENRRANWETPKGRWNIGDRTLNSTELAELIAWFRVCRGAAVPWTFKDWQTEQNVVVRFAQDEISFRFDAYRSSDEEAIWQLSGLEVIATELATEPPPPPPPPDCTPQTLNLSDPMSSSWTVIESRTSGIYTGASYSVNTTSGYWVQTMTYGDGTGAGYASYISWQSPLSYTPQTSNEIISINWGIDARFESEINALGGNSHPIGLVVLHNGVTYTGGSVDPMKNTSWATYTASYNVSFPITAGVPIHLGILRNNSNVPGSTGITTKQIGMRNFTAQVVVTCP